MAQSVGAPATSHLRPTYKPWLHKTQPSIGTVSIGDLDTEQSTTSRLKNAAAFVEQEQQARVREIMLQQPFVPRGSQFSHGIAKSPKPAHVCRWHTGCGRRFYSKRQLFWHLEEEHGLKKTGKAWRANGYGARLRRQDARVIDKPSLDSAHRASANPYDLPRYRKGHAPYGSNRPHDFRHAPYGSNRPHDFPAAAWYCDPLLTPVCNSAPEGLAPIQASAAKPPSAARAGSQPSRQVSFCPAETPPSGRVGDPP